MSSRREVLIRILRAITKEDVNSNKKSHIKILKMVVFDCAINEKCCSVDGGRGICHLFSSPVAVIFTVYHSQRYIFKSSHDFECSS